MSGAFSHIECNIESVAGEIARMALGMGLWTMSTGPGKVVSDIRSLVSFVKKREYPLIVGIVCADLLAIAVEGAPDIKGLLVWDLCFFTGGLLGSIVASTPFVQKNITTPFRNNIAVPIENNILNPIGDNIIAPLLGLGLQSTGRAHATE